MFLIRCLFWEIKFGVFFVEESILCIIGSIFGYVYCFFGYKIGVG